MLILPLLISAAVWFLGHPFPIFPSPESHELFSHQFTLYTLDLSVLEIFRLVTENVSLQYRAEAQDIDSFIFSIKRMNCPESNILLQSCIIHTLPLEQDRSCLVKPPHQPPRVEKLFQGNFEYNEVHEFITRSIGVSLESLNFSISQYHLSPGDECQRVKFSDLSLDDMILNHWLLQKPLVIEQFFEPKDRSELELILQKHRKMRVGAKLSYATEFEGIDDLRNWEMSQVQSIPRNILEQLESPELVVVRPSHHEISLGEFIDNIIAKNKDPLHNEIGAGKFSKYQFPNIYIEYLPVQDPQILNLVQQFLNISVVSPDLITALSEHFPFLKYLLNGNPHLWMGDGQTIGKTHFDPFDNILLQVEGSKIFRVVDPSNNARMYEGYMREAILETIPEIVGNGTTGRYRFLKRRLLESISLVHSPIDINLLSGYLDTKLIHKKQEQLTKYPTSRGILTMDCRVNKGEALWLPSYWWHEVTSIPGERENWSPLNIALNIWFDPLFRKEFPCKLCGKKKINQVYATKLMQLREMIKPSENLF